MCDNNKYLAFVILIGGKSARFGEDKGIFEFLGKPLISYQIETISKYNRNIYLVAHSQEQVENYTIKIETENVNGFFLDDREIITNKEIHTPMLGLYSAFKELNKLAYEKAFILSCDAPLIKYDLIELLIEQSEGFDCCIPRWDNGFLEPLFAIYPVKKALYRAKECIKSEKYKLTKILDDTWKINYISQSSIKAIDKKFISFININGPIDIEKLMKVYQRKSNYE